MTRAILALALSLALLLQPGCYLTRRVWKDGYAATAPEGASEARPALARVVVTAAKLVVTPLVFALDVLLFPAEAWVYLSLSPIRGNDCP